MYLYSNLIYSADLCLIKHIYKGVSLGSILILLSLLRENALFAYFGRLYMNELEEKYYSDIKEELVQSVIDKKIDTYFTNRNELSHYYNVGKMSRWGSKS